MSQQSVNLLNFDRKSLRDYFKSLNEKPYHADQIIQWIHQYGHADFSEMTNLSLSLRKYLNEKAIIGLPTISKSQLSTDGTQKWLLILEDGAAIEMVFIPEDDRGTLCVSSQVGCAMGCQFCATGSLGYQRNLTTAEIIGQVWLAVRELSKKSGQHDRQITNVVLMGMGEPLLNLDNVIPALNLMLDDLAYGFSKYRVTVSTAGIVPGMDRLSKESIVSIAVSLHAPNDELRNQLMPINKKYPLSELIPACKRYFPKGSRQTISFEYVMIHEVNDSLILARELVKLLQNLPCKINLIPCNPTDCFSYQPSSYERLEAFRDVLVKAGFNVIIRKRRGADIDAACGQLVGKAGVS